MTEALALAAKPPLGTYLNDHLNRMKAAVLRGHSLNTVAPWICENTFLKGQPFSFVGHEFQLGIAKDQSRVRNVRKCSQVGISELSTREVMALLCILDASTFIYTLPTAAFAKTFAKTRIDPVVRTSPTLKTLLNATADNTEIKQFGDSFLYVKGTIGQAAAISVPADGVVHDEWDFSDIAVASNYESRLTHSAYKFKRKFSTPTVTGYGISAEMDVSRRHWYMVKCDHCALQFVPSYFAHVKIPGWDHDLKEITKDKLPRIAVDEAKLLCPGCGLEPSLRAEHRQWVVENTGDHFEAAGYQIQPFDAPDVVTIPDLVRASCNYDRYVDFINFGLGLPAEDKESTITKADIDACYAAGGAGGTQGFFTNVMGVDMGLICHIFVVGVDAYGRILQRHAERVPLAQVFERKHELQAKFRVQLTVMDSQPYADMLMRLQARDDNLYGAVYVNSKDIAVYAVKKLEEKEEATPEERKVKAGEEQIRQVNINRSRGFDGLMEAVRAGSVLLVEDENRTTITAHLQDMKRVKDFNSDKEISYVWRKSAKGVDHFHHALLYAWVASKMKSVAGSLVLLPGLMRKFTVKQLN